MFFPFLSNEHYSSETMQDYASVNNGVNIAIECDAKQEITGKGASLESCVFRRAGYHSLVSGIFLFLQSPRRKAV